MVVTPENYDGLRDRLLARISSDGNRDVARRFADERRAQGNAVTTCINDLNVLVRIDDHLAGRPYESLTRADVASFVNLRRSRRLHRARRGDGTHRDRHSVVKIGDHTAWLRRLIVRVFVRWLRGTEDYPPEVKWLPTRRPKRRLPTDSLLRPSELRALMAACRDERERATLAVLAESGMRAGEFCSVSWENIAFNDDPALGCLITLPQDVPGLKTGSRAILLLESTPYLQAWDRADPRPRPARTPAFPCDPHGSGFARMSLETLDHFVKRIARRAGVRKRVHPHLFRHIAATLRARCGWQEGELRAFFGWTDDSAMPAHYVHLAGLDYQEMEYVRRGLKPARGYADMGIPVSKCPRCATLNLPTAPVCHACGQGLGLAGAAAPIAVPSDPVCHHCGGRFGAGPAPSGVAPPPPPATGAGAALVPSAPAVEAAKALAAS